MSSEKPGIGRDYNTRTWAERVTLCLDAVMGRKSRKARQVRLTAVEVTTTPTAAEFNAVVADLNTIKARYNELLQQVQD